VFIKKETPLWAGKYLVLFWIVLLPAFYILASVQVVSRYLLLILPFLIIAGLAGIDHLGRALKLSQRRISVLILVVVGLTFAENQIFYWSKVKPALDYCWNQRLSQADWQMAANHDKRKCGCLCP
jgi:hypothetical protein